MTHLARVVTFSVLVSACAVAQTKVYACFDAPVRVVMNNPFPLPRHVLFEPLPLHQEGFDLISPGEFKVTRILRPPEFTMRYGTMADPGKVSLLLLFRVENSRLCQMADRDSNGSIQFH